MPSSPARGTFAGSVASLALVPVTAGDAVERRQLSVHVGLVGVEDRKRVGCRIEAILEHAGDLVRHGRAQRGRVPRVASGFLHEVVELEQLACVVANASASEIGLAEEASHLIADALDRVETAGLRGTRGVRRQAWCSRRGSSDDSRFRNHRSEIAPRRRSRALRSRRGS